MNFAPAANIDMPTCTKSVTIKVKHENETAIILLKQGREILVDNTEIIKIPAKIFDDLIKIRFASSTMLLVAFRDGLKLWWDGMTRVYIGNDNFGKTFSLLHVLLYHYILFNFTYILKMHPHHIEAKLQGCAAHSIRINRMTS